MDQKLTIDIKKYFKKKQHIVAVYVFGSQAKGRAKKDSDVDIAVLCAAEHVLDVYQKMAMQDELSTQLQNRVDLVIMNIANPVLKHQIYKYGRLIFCHDQRVAGFFFARALGEYDDVRRVRRLIEKKILTHTIYG